MISEQSTLTVPVSSGDHVQGSATAPITLVEYGDYQCPYCGGADAVVKGVQQELGQRLRFVFRNFPLTQAHEYALGAARAAEAAAQQGKFWEMHDMLYENQSALDSESIRGYAQNLGLDMDKFQSDIDDAATEQKIRNDMEGGMHSDVQGTPTFFVNGKQYQGPTSVQGLLQGIRSAGNNS